MKKVVLKKPMIFAASTLVCAFILMALYFINVSGAKFDNDNSDDMQYVSRLFGSEDMPVVNTESIIMRPYTDENVKIVQNFYNYKDEEKAQENAITNYEQTYIQNTGVAYGGIENGFDVIASLPGTITEVREDKLLGNIVEIKCNDKVTIVYQGLSEVNVRKDASVNQGDIIGKSGETNLNKDLGSHIIFKLKINGEYVNPEDYYDKNVNEL